MVGNITSSLLKNTRSTASAPLSASASPGSAAPRSLPLDTASSKISRAFHRGTGCTRLLQQLRPPALSSGFPCGGGGDDGGCCCAPPFSRAAFQLLPCVLLALSPMTGVMRSTTVSAAACCRCGVFICYPGRSGSCSEVKFTIRSTSTARSAVWTSLGRCYRKRRNVFWDAA